MQPIACGQIEILIKLQSQKSGVLWCRAAFVWVTRSDFRSSRKIDRVNDWRWYTICLKTKFSDVKFVTMITAKTRLGRKCIQSVRLLETWEERSGREILRVNRINKQYTAKERSAELTSRDWANWSKQCPPLAKTAKQAEKVDHTVCLFIPMSTSECVHNEIRWSFCSLII